RFKEHPGRQGRMIDKPVRIAPGIYRSKTGLRAYQRVVLGRGATRLLSKQFPEGTSTRTMKEWQEEQRVRYRELRGPVAAFGTFAADVDRYLGQIAAMPS